MAKKSNSAKVVAMDDYSPSVYLDVKSMSDLKDLELGDEVTVVIQGKVSSLSQREGYEGKAKGELCIKDYEIKITGPDEWAELAKDD
jgi:hypothetical protein